MNRKIKEQIYINTITQKTSDWKEIEKRKSYKRIKT